MGEHGASDIRPNYMVRDFFFQNTDNGKSVAAVRTRCIFCKLSCNFVFVDKSREKKKILGGSLSIRTMFP